MLELKLFTEQVEKMRHAQTRYFELASKSRKTKGPDDIKATKDMLIMAKALEKDVDVAVKRITNNIKIMAEKA